MIILLHITFVDLYLVRNTYVDLDLVHIPQILVHNTSIFVVWNQGDGSRECSPCPRRVHGLKDY